MLVPTYYRNSLLRGLKHFNMKILTVLFSLFCTVLPFLMINDVSMLRVLFGNVTEMRDLFLPRFDDISSTEESSLEEEDTMDDIKEYLKYSSTNSHGNDNDTNRRIYNHDLTEFNKISKSLDDIAGADFNGLLNTRRQQDYGKIDKEDGDNTTKENEMNRRTKLQKLMLTMLIHIRFKVDMAVRQREIGRGSKSYRLGYLFSRLRNIKFFMAKIMNAMIRENHDRWVEKVDYAYLLKDYTQEYVFRLYERIMHLDAEARGIIGLIHEVADEVNPMTTTVSDD